MLARKSCADSLASVSAAGADQDDPVKNVLERFRSFELQLQGARGGAEALFVLQVCLLGSSSNAACTCCHAASRQAAQPAVR